MTATSKTTPTGVLFTVTAAMSPCTLQLGNVDASTVGTIAFQARCADWVAASASIVPKIRINNSDGSFVAADDQNIPYQNAATLTDIAAGTQIAANGVYYLRADLGIVSLLVTVASGSVDICYQGGVG